MNRFAVRCLLLCFLCVPAQCVEAQTPPVEALTAGQLQRMLRETGATLTVVNFWATWCAPCIEEFPDYVRLGKDLADQGVRVFFVSMDFEDELPAVEAFLAEQGYFETSFLRTGDDHAFITAVHEEWTGVLPATFLYSRKGGLADFWQGKPVGYEALKERVLHAMQP